LALYVFTLLSRSLAACLRYISAYLCQHNPPILGRQWNERPRKLQIDVSAQRELFSLQLVHRGVLLFFLLL